MHFDLKRPCHNCPFLRVGGIRLYRSRIEEIGVEMLDSQGSTFACHKTTPHGGDSEDDSVMTKDSRHCAGALIFAEKNGNATQAMRIAERLRIYDAKALMDQKDIISLVFDDLKEMLKANEPNPPRLQKKRGRK